jgi:hypothetical protein
VARTGIPRRFHPCCIAAALLGLLLAACLSSAPHATTLSLVRGDLLPLDHPWTTTRLELEAEHDRTLRRWLQQSGMPDYLLVESSDLLRLFYVRQDQMVIFRRRDEPASVAEVVPWIGALYHSRFSDTHRLALGELRFQRAGLVMNPEWRDPRPASERNADAVADLMGQEPWRPRAGTVPQPAAPHAPERRSSDDDVALVSDPAFDENEAAYSAESGTELAFSAWSRPAAFAAWSSPVGPLRPVRFTSISASMGRWSTARADGIGLRSSRSLR